jgi:hypothetical protein
MLLPAPSVSAARPGADADRAFTAFWGQRLGRNHGCQFEMYQSGLRYVRLENQTTYAPMSEQNMNESMGCRGFSPVPYSDPTSMPLHLFSPLLF